MRIRIGMVPITGCMAMLVATAGCQGNVKVRVLKSGELAADSTLPGVIFYPPQYVKITHSFTTLVNEAGQVIGAAPQACTRIVQKQEITIMPDFQTPMLISNDSHGPSSAKFSVTLTNGMLISVNSEPTQKLSEVLSASTPLLSRPAAAVSRPGQPQGRPACNAGPEVSDFRKTVLASE